MSSHHWTWAIRHCKAAYLAGSTSANINALTPEGRASALMSRAPLGPAEQHSPVDTDIAHTHDLVVESVCPRR